MMSHMEVVCHIFKSHSEVVCQIQKSIHPGNARDLCIIHANPSPVHIPHTLIHTIQGLRLIRKRDGEREKA
jgi:hypothetical protein